MNQRTDAELTRSEEELRVSSTWNAVERVSLTTRIVTEQQQVTVTVRRQELIVERHPASGTVTADVVAPEDAAPLVIVLHREEPVVEMRVVPVERVSVLTTRVTEQQDIAATVRAERIETDETP